MYAYEDISVTTRTAIRILWAYMVLNALYGIGTFYVIFMSPQPEDGGLVWAVDLLGLAYFLVLIAAFIIVGRWIYRASSNAHSLGQEMTITPGWAVGWYFVPFANLIKPFQAMKETWQASHYRGLEYETAPALLNWWWGLWILTNILGNISVRMSTEAPELGAVVDLADGIINVPLSLVLIAIMKQVVEAQDLAIRHDVFA